MSDFSAYSSQMSVEDVQNTYLVETAWEVCNQVGGIYTVIRSKIPVVKHFWGDNYLLLGPYMYHHVQGEFDHISDENDVFSQVADQMRSEGIEVHYGRWLVSGRPKTMLFNVGSVWDKLGEIKYYMWEQHGIPGHIDDDLVNQVYAFGYIVHRFFQLLDEKKGEKKVVGHFHEWMGGIAIPRMRKDQLDITTVFTTHATMLGRYLAMNDPMFYEYLPFYDWEKEAINFNIEAQVKMERAASHGAHVMSTVSEVTDRECEHLLGRKSDVILPNGLNIERFNALHEFQNLHLKHKASIHEFVMGHFFPSYAFDLDKTLYFFTSGRYEVKNKGFDLTLEALARLNWKMKEANIDKNVVMFIVTKRPFHSINPLILQSRASLNELKKTCVAIEYQVGSRLFTYAATSDDHKLPNLNDYVDDYWRLRYRRTLQSWKTDRLPYVVTHSMVDSEDGVLDNIRSVNLVNQKDDKVKVVYHPDFISSTNPLFGIDYTDFVRGCHLGVFPSYYEPWGYTPLESMASGVPAITSDYAGFGRYVESHVEDPEDKGIYLVHRHNRSWDEAANDLADQMFKFVQQNRRERIAQRNATESESVNFDWRNLYRFYMESYTKAMERLSVEQ